MSWSNTYPPPIELVKRRLVVYIDNGKITADYSRRRIVKIATDALIRDVETYLKEYWDKVEAGYYLVQELKRYRGREFATTLHRAGLLLDLNNLRYPISADLESVLGRRFAFSRSRDYVVCRESTFGEPPGPEIDCYGIYVTDIYLLRESGYIDDAPEHNDVQIEFYLNENRPGIYMYVTDELTPDDLAYYEEQEECDEDQEDCNEEQIDEEEEYMRRLREKFTVWESSTTFTLSDDEWMMNKEWKMIIPRPELVRVRKKLEDRTIDVMLGQSILMVREWNKRYHAGLLFTVPYMGDRVEVDYWLVAPKNSEVNHQAVIPVELLKKVLSDLHQDVVNRAERRKILESGFWNSTVKVYDDDIEKLKQSAWSTTYYVYLVYP